MPKLRLIKILLGVVIALFIGATTYISALVVERQNALEQVSRYNIAWLVSQATTEYARLEQRVSAFGLPGSKVSVDEVKLRFDIVFNRLALLQSGEVEEFVKIDPEYRATVEALSDTLSSAQSYLENLKASDSPELLRILLPLDSRLARLAAAANRVGGDRVAEDQHQLITLHWIFSSLAGGLVLCGIALIALLMWHNRLLQRAHHDMRILADDLQRTSENLAVANQDVKDANNELEKQNNVLIRRDRELRTQNERFDAALNNMSQALCLVDAKQNLVVCNQRYQELFGFDKHLLIPGTPIRHLIEFLSINGGDDIGLRQIWANQQALIREHRAATSFEELSDGRTFGISHQPLSEGGWVATYEDLTERRRAEARIAHLAHHDALTDLPNRTLFHQQMNDWFRRIAQDGGQFAVMCLDLDGFKVVNDTLGHPVGDILLTLASLRLKDAVRAEDLVARIGGDEFAVLLKDADPNEMSKAATRILEAIANPFEIDGQHINIGTSVGIAVAPIDGDTADKLLKNADLALYRAKAEGRGTSCFFEAKMDSQLQARRQTELDLRTALGTGEFEVYYQPLVNLASGEISGCEALLRWKHPTRGFVSPAEFIPIAEEIGLIAKIGEWVIRQACMTAASWPASINVAVNLSPIQFKSPHLVQSIVLALAASGLPAQRLELEITESVLLQNDDTTLAVLHEIRALGVKVALDDFGTGYSSLGYLRRFPFDKIKIDRIFVQEMTTDQDSMAIVRAVIDLAHSLRMTTTGEGVETAEQMEQLQSAGCTEVQGFYLFRPQPADALPKCFATPASIKTVAA
ncbi:MAG TPA: EAL domain-containing protein [Xanthobacteraceae bacterium]|jgi:diguanylate cyclase (GGDEF)-like protein|nr:EAL domain-containing protein [Xanthobacteraceae bacterium]